jgi:hypothetical protein
MESSVIQNMEEVVKFLVESKHKVICSGRNASLLGDLNFFGGVVRSSSSNVYSCDFFHFVDRKNPIGGGNSWVVLDTSMKGGGHYLLRLKRGPSPPILPSSRGLG